MGHPLPIRRIGSPLSRIFIHVGRGDFRLSLPRPGSLPFPPFRPPLLLRHTDGPARCGGDDALGTRHGRTHDSQAGEIAQESLALDVDFVQAGPRTGAGENLLWKASLAATPAAYAGDAIAGKALNDAERKMTLNLSRRLLAIVGELLSPPKKPNR